jgi:hypothetical protein
MAGTFAAHAAETLKLKTVVSVPGGKITSFDISFVDTASGLYLLGDRTNKGIDVIDTATNTFLGIVGQGLFTGAQASNDVSGPDGVMVVNVSEIWGGDGDSTLKFFSLADGGFLGQIDTFAPAVASGKLDPSQGRTRVDEMCYDSFHNIGFVANNASDPPFITAVDVGTHTILGQIFFDGTNGTPKATDGIEQCQFNPRDNMIYVAVPEVDGPGDNSVRGGVSRIDPTTSQVVQTALIDFASCSGPQGMAIGPPPQILLGCNGAIAPKSATIDNSFLAPPTRPTAVIDDGSTGGTFGDVIFRLDNQAGNDMVTFNAADNHYYLARSGNNTFNNFNPALLTTPGQQFLTCPGTVLAKFGGNIFVSRGLLGPSSTNVFAGPAVLGMVNAATGVSNADTITGLANCSATNPGPGSKPNDSKPIRVPSGATNTHGAGHSVAADSAHNQIYVPIASTAGGTVCSSGGGQDANGCIAVFQTVGSDP